MIMLKDKEFNLLAHYIKNNYGIHLKEGKKTLLASRLNNYLKANNFNCFSDYYDQLIEDKTGMIASELVERITTNHTYFLREAQHFNYLWEKVLPELKKRAKGKDLRIWSAGCSTGEEAYTLAMVINEFFGEEKGLWDTKILATDISKEVLDQGINGIYPYDKIKNISKPWQDKYFDKLDEETYQIKSKIREEILFRRFNLMEGIFPFKKKFQVIFCRNVMIYFDDETRHKLLNKFYNGLEDGGYLFIGHSETINREKVGFSYIQPSVYRKGN
ncbi:chemotaxis protein methyltransferase CheR [Natranaerovirga pectinivora]|uniref:protein-glutamate O-methyltransferase n=1 Tax=Natranaerovirga pectinivora TaxID=682400 RepID=A0A4R3MEC0_9FIRM|nr:protein-glutamate O-methyltransferase CheR [Natranaerovirga pectinivora]TCT12134.1 chemotaxis protein methyltransferase CheR [Natranaerovirga pectinivora]